MKLSSWKFKVDLQSNDDRHPDLVKDFDEVKSLGAIEFSGVGEGESSICGRFQVEVVTLKWEDELAEEVEIEERIHMHRKVTGSCSDNISKLYSKDRDEYEAMHATWGRDPPMTGEIHCGVNSFSKI